MQTTTQKNSFIFRAEYCEPLKTLPYEEMAALLWALSDYSSTGAEPVGLSPAAMMAFSFIRPKIDEDNAKYQETCAKNRANGKAGGRPRKKEAQEPDETEKTEENPKNPVGFEETEKTHWAPTEPKKPDKDRDKDMDRDRDRDINPPVAPPAGERETRMDYQAVVDAFNRLCPSLPSVREISDGRKRAIRSISRAIEKHGGWERYFRRVEASDFLAGRTGWHGCGFDWILKPASATKIIEGNYDNKQDGKPRAREPSYDLNEEVARAFRQFGGGGIAE